MLVAHKPFVVLSHRKITILMLLEGLNSMLLFSNFTHFPRNADYIFNAITICIEESSLFFSLMMLALMTVNRYVAVLRPLRYKTVFNRSSMVKVMTLIIIITGFLFCTMLTPYLIYLCSPGYKEVYDTFFLILDTGAIQTT